MQMADGNLREQLIASRECIYPNEILLSVLKLLDGVDLKSSRLVSQSWCACASVYLFEEIYVSSAEENLKIFEAIAHNHLLSSCVKHLRYDATEFIYGLSKQQYIRELHEQNPFHFIGDYCIPWATLDPDVTAWVEQVLVGRLRPHETVQKFRSSRLINDGHQNYKRHADYQRKILKNGQFLERLVCGLSKLKSLKAVTLEGSWKYLREFEQRHIGSFLARHWPRFYCKPQNWVWGDYHEIRKENIKLGNATIDGSDSYRIITAALAKAQCRITSFTIGTREYPSPGVPPPLFNTSRPATREMVKYQGMDIRAFSGLRRCVLRLASHRELSEEGKPTPELFGNIVGLKKLLDSMDHLVHLELRLPDDLGEPPILYTEDHVLPVDKTWSALESLTLVNLACTATSLIYLVLCQAPSLSHLGIGGMTLFEDSWEAFFEALAQSQQLHSFSFEPNTYLFRRDGSDFIIDRETSTLFEDLEDYVVLGGRNPCLDKDQPDDAACEFLSVFKPCVRHQLSKFNIPNTKSSTSI